jgi:hypothetical protein
MAERSARLANVKVLESHLLVLANERGIRVVYVLRRVLEPNRGRLLGTVSLSSPLFGGAVLSVNERGRREDGDGGKRKA